jgi:hypothetical protein
MKPNQEPAMNSYQASTPRARTAISLAAAAMAALTLGLSVLPAKVNSGGSVGPVAKASRAADTMASATPGDGMPIVVYGMRGPETAMQKVWAPHVGPPMKQQI